MTIEEQIAHVLEMAPNADVEHCGNEFSINRWGVSVKLSNPVLLTFADEEGGWAISASSA